MPPFYLKTNTYTEIVAHIPSALCIDVTLEDDSVLHTTEVSLCFHEFHGRENSCEAMQQ